MPDVEVLAPAGSVETLTAAVRSGADAVYLGSKAFSARRGAENFDDGELKNAVEYCHIHGVKVYLTHNIMIKDYELDDALKLAEYANDIGIDGIIVQDLGLAYAIHCSFPQIQLHASTQMSVHSPSALPFLKNLGFCRVVAAREMSHSQLKVFCAAAKNLGMSVEVFVHGALCMSVSGQCLLSSMLGGRSGNRGLCAGPCRLPFEAPNGNGYDLSLKDLSLFKHIAELKAMGVSSLKIEGRMKRPEYVAAAVFACRSAVDTGNVPEEFDSALSGVFSRSGFTDAYFSARLGRDMFGIRTKEDVQKAGETFAFLHDIYRNERQSVPIDIALWLNVGENAVLTVSDGINTVSVSGDKVETADKRPSKREEVLKSITKLGGTAYYADNTEIDMSDNVFAPASMLNSLRRDAVEELDKKRSETALRPKISHRFSEENIKHLSKPTLIARVPSADMIDVTQSTVTYMLPMEADFEAVEDCDKVIIEMPRWIENEQRAASRLAELYGMGVRRAYCGNLSAVALAKEAGFEVIGGIGLNVCNSESVKVLDKAGVSSVTLTPEMKLQSAVSLKSPLPKGVFAYGRLPLMLLRSCPLKNGRSCDKCDRNGYVTDRKGIRFPVKCRENISELFNSTPHFLADRLSETVGLDFLLLYFTDEPFEKIKDILYMYENGGKPGFEYTRGAYFRETL